MTSREPLARTPEEQAEEDAFLALYGDWAALTPPEVAELLQGFDRPWWIVGGWAVEAASGVAREHEDVDVSMRACDVPALYEHLKGEWHVWNNNEGTIHPLSDEHPHAREPANQLWLRRNAASPWVMDVILIADRDGRWVSRRDPEHVAQVDEVTWLHSDGIRYQRPEIVLLHKAFAARRKDERDLRVTWPALDDAGRLWLAEQVGRLYPDHPWLAVFDSLTTGARADQVRPGDAPAGRPS